MISLAKFVKLAGKDPEKWKRAIGAKIVSVHPERGTGVIEQVFKKQRMLCLTVRYANGTQDVYAPSIAKTHKDLLVMDSSKPTPANGGNHEALLFPQNSHSRPRERLVRPAAPNLENARPFIAFAGQELSRWQMLVGQKVLVTNKPRPLAGLVESVSERRGSIRLMIQFETVEADFADPTEILKMSVSDEMRPWIVPFSHGWTKEGRLGRKYEQTLEGRVQPSQADLFSFFARSDYETWRCLEGHETEHHYAPLGEAKVLKVEKGSLGIVLILRYSDGEIGKLYTGDVHRVHDTITIPRNLAMQYRKFCSKTEQMASKRIQELPKPEFMGKRDYSRNFPPSFFPWPKPKSTVEWIFLPCPTRARVSSSSLEEDH